jgi:hypothetical protein
VSWWSGGEDDLARDGAGFRQAQDVGGAGEREPGGDLLSAGTCLEPVSSRVAAVP